MAEHTTAAEQRTSAADWKAIVAKYQEPSSWRASWQILNTLGSFLALWALMYWSLEVSWLLTAPLAILAGLFLVRIFKKIGLYRDWPVSKGCTPPYVPVWVEAMVKRKA
jgi:fatty acid desaturase